MRAISTVIKKQIKEEVTQIIQAGNRPPHLVAIMVGDNPASKAYVGNKVRTCEELNIRSTLMHFDASISQPELLDVIEKVNGKGTVDGFILQ